MSPVPGPCRLALRGLRQEGGAAILAALGLAVATAAIAGALVIDGMRRAALEDLLLRRLAGVEAAVRAPRPLGEALLAAARSVAPACTVAALRTHTAVASRADDGRATPAALLGADRDIARLVPGIPPLAPRAAAISPALAADLGLAVGDSLLLAVAARDAAPAGTFLAEDRPLRTRRQLRVQVAAVLADAGAFSLEEGLAPPRTVWVDRAWLAGALGESGADTLLIAGDPAPLAAALARSAAPEDLGLHLRAADDGVRIQGDGLLLPPSVGAALRNAIGPVAAEGLYLADRIDAGERTSSYALVAAAEDVPALAGLDEDGIACTAWLAEDLGVRPGDRLRVRWPLPGPVPAFRDDQLTVRTVLPATSAVPGAALVPPLPGMADAGRIADWDLPYPVAPARVTARDETWWEAHRAAPKAFIAPGRLRALWAASGAPWVASLRLPAPDHAGAARLAETLRGQPELMRDLAPRPLRAQALARAAGNADLGELFLGLGAVLVAAGAATAALLLRLRLDRRRRAAGLLLAIGWRPAQVRMAWWIEGVLIAIAGGLAGMVLAGGYAALLAALMAGEGLRAAAGVPLAGAWRPLPLLAGGATGVAIGMAAVAWSLRGLGRRTAGDLLARPEPEAPDAGPGGWRAPMACLGLACAALLASATGLIPAAIAAPLAGLLLLVAGIAGLLPALRAWRRRCAPGPTSLVLAAIGHRPRHARLAAGLAATTSFLLLVVAAQDRPTPTGTAPGGPGGGFALVVDTALPLRIGIAHPADRARLGFTADEETLFAGATVAALLVGPGDDISCANPARPAQPRLLGLADGVLPARDAFAPDAPGWSALADGGEPAPALGDAESVRWTLHAAPGATVACAGGPVRIAACFPASVLSGDLVIAGAAFRRRFPAIDAPRRLLVAVPAEYAAAAADTLRRRLAPWGPRVRTVAEELATTGAVRTAYLRLFLALGGAGLALGAAGLAALLAMAAGERRGAQALLAASGVPARRLRRLLLAEHALPAAAGTLLGAVAAGIATPPLGRPDPRAWAVAALLVAAALAIALAAATWAARARPGLLDDLRRE